MRFPSLFRSLWNAGRDRSTSRSNRAAPPWRSTGLRVEPLEDRCLLSFGTGGVVTTDLLATQGDWIEAVALQADTKIVAAGNNGLARYNTDGILDLTFNALGSQPGTIAAGNYQHYFNDVALHDDGKIVAGGMKLVANELSFLVSRYTAAGIPDSTFGVNGEVTLNINGTADNVIEALAIQPGDQKIVAVGWAGGSSKPQWVVMRILPNGSLDTSFDRDGTLTTTFGGKTSKPKPYAVVLQPDGKILMAGKVNSGTTNGDDFALARYNTNGSLDLTFGAGGKVLTDFGSEYGYTNSHDVAHSVALQSDGKIVVSGSSNAVGGRAPIARYNANGSLDTTFGGDGKVVASTGFGDYAAVSVQSDGKIVAVGGYQIERINPNGSPDTSFDGDGRRSLFLGDPYPFIYDAKDVVIQPDGKILVGGVADSVTGTQFALERFNPDGSPDAAALLRAAKGPNPTVAPAATLTADQLQPLLAEAARGGVPGMDTSKPAGATVRIVDLAGGSVGMAVGNAISLDGDAAGWGWFVEATPGDDSEFASPDNQGGQTPMEWLTVLKHDLGHMSRKA